MTLLAFMTVMPYAKPGTQIAFWLVRCYCWGFATVVAGAIGADSVLVASIGVVVLNCLLLLCGEDSVVDKGSAVEAGGIVICF